MLFGLGPLASLRQEVDSFLAFFQLEIANTTEQSGGPLTAG